MARTHRRWTKRPLFIWNRQLFNVFSYPELQITSRRNVTTVPCRSCAMRILYENNAEINILSTLLNFHRSDKDRKCIAPENMNLPKILLMVNFSLFHSCTNQSPIECALPKSSVKTRIVPIQLRQKISIRLSSQSHKHTHNNYAVFVVRI